MPSHDQQKSGNEPIHYWIDHHLGNCLPWGYCYYNTSFVFFKKPTIAVDTGRKQEHWVLALNSYEMRGVKNSFLYAWQGPKYASENIPLITGNLKTANFLSHLQMNLRMTVELLSDRSLQSISKKLWERQADDLT